MIIEQLYANLEIPADLLPSEANCTAVIQFVVNVDGSLSDFMIRRAPSESSGQAALKATMSLQDLPLWQPALYRGRPTKILYTLPVRFDR